MQKTAVVMVERVKKHGMLDKWIKYRKKFKVSDHMTHSHIRNNLKLTVS